MQMYTTVIYICISEKFPQEIRLSNQLFHSLYLYLIKMASVIFTISCPINVNRNLIAESS